VKNCLAVIGLGVIFLGVVLAVVLAPEFIPELALVRGNLLALDLDRYLGEPVIDTTISGGSPGQMTSLIEFPPTPTNTIIPTAAPTATPEPTATPLPDPVDYRTRVMVRARMFSTAYNAFMETNGRLQSQPDLISDPVWRAQVRASLDEFTAAAWAMSQAGTVPPEYQAVQTWLEAIGPEAEALRSAYLYGIETGDQSSLVAAGQSMDKLVVILTNVEAQMIAAGWNN
jgi:hypothetical protein